MFHAIVRISLSHFTNTKILRVWTYSIWTYIFRILRGMCNHILHSSIQHNYERLYNSMNLHTFTTENEPRINSTIDMMMFVLSNWEYLNVFCVIGRSAIDETGIWFRFTPTQFQLRCPQTNWTSSIRLYYEHCVFLNGRVYAQILHMSCHIAYSSDNGDVVSSLFLHSECQWLTFEELITINSI